MMPNFLALSPFVGYLIVGFLSFLRTKMWDFFHTGPTQHPTIPPKYALREVGYLHLHT
jgi:hypothetical protein